MKLKTLVYFSVLTLVASVVPAAHAQTFSVVHNFKGGPFDGAFPGSGVTIKGNTLYGTTSDGGVGCNVNLGCGTVYQIRHVGSDWFETLIARFFNDGIGPFARAVFGPDGHLYGTTIWANQGQGSVYRLTPPLSLCRTAACFWTAHDIHRFTEGDGSSPLFGDLIWDQQGNLYGTTSTGGKGGSGTVFQMTGSGDNWTETPIHNFTFGQGDGLHPYSGVVIDSNGNLFGTTSSGGANFDGCVYELAYDPQAGWKETILYSFTGGSDGAGPFAGVTLDSSGNLYGASVGGPQGPAIFELSPSGSTWVFKVLYQLPPGSGPVYASLTLDAAGNLYGTTQAGGAFGNGTVFKLTNTENGWVYTLLHDFTGGADGKSPESQVTIDTDGTLYGTAYKGGSSDRGVVWMIKP